ncbi:hypothetical protein [Humibacter sp.]|jgi:hypothetical protein|uniref:hypothetical protein n=1 Tax=Humibacter sp. TaxID=1940291 RepID=UPI002BE2E2D1|nr:hypothetical protein [Humibacter sp.]HVX09509.1 hypothetical protein [Humibacter sp.]
MTGDERRGRITRRQALIGGAGIVVVGASAVVAGQLIENSARAGGGTGSDGNSIRPGASSRPKRMLQAAAFCGVYYGRPTIRLTGATNELNKFQLDLPIGATSWQVLDARGRRVGHGSMSARDSKLTVCTDGVWHGGSRAVPGHYTVVTNAGSNGVVTGTVVVCPPTKLHVPMGQPAIGAWLAVAPDRDLYSYRPGQIPDLVSALKHDPYFTGAQDRARPRPVWIAPSPQAQAPKLDPSPQDWGDLAAALRAAGYAGAYYECPTNEPENGGWSMPALISYWTQCRSAILAADPTAHVLGFDSAGVMSATTLDGLGRFLDSCKVDGFTDHLENSHQNLSNIVALRQLFGALKDRFTDSQRPDLDLWLTETGILGGGYGVLQPRREARQRTVLRLVFESFGWPKEHSYDFRVFDAFGSGLPTYMVDGQNGGTTGNLRAGAYAVHVMSEALHGTTCTPQKPPTALRFGPKGGVGDSLFAGLHYRGVDNDVVVLAANGMERSTVDLSVSASGSLEVWDGMGVPSTVQVADGRVSIPLDDLLTYVFLPAGSSVSVAPSWWSSLDDAARGKKVKASSGHASVITSGGFGANLQGGTVPVPAQPYATTSLPATFEVKTTKPAKGFALFTGGPAWQTVGCSIVEFEIAVDGKTVYSYTCESARSLPIPSPSSDNSSDPCLYTTYWTGPFAWLEKVDIPAGTVRLTVKKTSYGGQPDRLASTAPGGESGEGDGQRLQLAAWQLLA